jgi:hypothetical protein
LGSAYQSGDTKHISSYYDIRLIFEAESADHLAPIYIPGPHIHEHELQLGVL